MVVCVPGRPAVKVPIAILPAYVRLPHRWVGCRGTLAEQRQS